MTRKRTSEKELVVSTGAAAAAPRRSRARAKHVAPETPAVSAIDQEIAAPAETPNPAYQPSHEEIARLAYSYWEARGFQPGNPAEDWLRAEQELRLNASASLATCIS